MLTVSEPENIQRGIAFENNYNRYVDFNVLEPECAVINY